MMLAKTIIIYLLQVFDVHRLRQACVFANQLNSVPAWFSLVIGLFGFWYWDKPLVLFVSF
jgi:hypothetical protein